MKKVILIFSYTLPFLMYGQELKLKVKDTVYTNSIIEITYINNIPKGQYMCWFMDGTIKEKGIIDNSKINSEFVNYNRLKDRYYVDSFYKATNVKRCLENDGIFSTFTGNLHQFISLSEYSDKLDKVVYDYYNSFKITRLKYSTGLRKNKLIEESHFKSYKTENGIFWPIIDSLIQYDENGNMVTKIFAEKIYEFKTSKIFSEKIQLFNRGVLKSEDQKYYEIKVDILKDIKIIKSIMIKNKSKVSNYYIIDSWNNKIKI